MYAQLCKRIQKELETDIDKSKSSTFLQILLNVCRDKFENRVQYSEKIINSESTLTDDLEEKKNVAKQKILGNVKFIGELYKLGMLVEAHLHKMLRSLFTNKSSSSTEKNCEDMECLAQLIRTCGKNLDTELGKQLMDQYFERMEKYSQSQSMFPPRIRFMLRDLIELRKNNWTPRKVALVEGPAPIQELNHDDDVLPPGLNHLRNRDRDYRNMDRSEQRDWIGKFSLNLHNLNDGFNLLSVSSPSPLLPSSYNQSSNGYGNRDHRDNGGGGGGGGNYRMHNNRNNQNNYGNNNMRYNKHNNHHHQGSGGGGMRDGGNGSHSSSYGGNSGMMSNKDLAPRFKRNLMTPPQNPVEELQMRPTPNSLLFKANMNIKPQLPISSSIGPRQLGGNENGNAHLNKHYTDLHQQHHHHHQGQQNLQGPIGDHGNREMNGDRMMNHYETPSHNRQHMDPLNQSLLNPISGVTSNNSSLMLGGKLTQKEQIVKQASTDKTEKKKKDKGMSKEDHMKRVVTFVSDVMLENIKQQIEDEEQKKNACIEENEEKSDMETKDATVKEVLVEVVDKKEEQAAEPLTKPIESEPLVNAFCELKLPEKFMRDAMIAILNQVLDRNDAFHAKTIEFLQILNKESKLSHSAALESFKSIVNGMNEKEKTIPKITSIIASLLARAVAVNLCGLADVANFTENGQHYPLFLLVLQHLHKQLGKQPLQELFNKSKVNLMASLPECDRTKDRMAEILEDRNLNFLYPLLRVQAELWKQILSDANPQQFYKWIKENVESSCYAEPGFIVAIMTVLLKYIHQESENLKEDKKRIEKEKEILTKYCPVLNAFLNGNNDLQLTAVYAIQVYWYSIGYPKGVLLRWFQEMYELSVIEEDAFLRYKEDVTDIYPGKGKALFQVNQWLTWLAEAEDEDDDEED
ncbi:AGAP004750-PA [Anopheles gambiae str. PEST]|uniref:Eukaryotic translation initiation factor 4 gamma 2 n=1 Tax=Anopheles gambiae TaxID=7165 RepID=Q7Q2P5_ANOGA|nr:AGAP004750-PA [Anopheles gambiae str. PEST]